MAIVFIHMFVCASNSLKNYKLNKKSSDDQFLFLTKGLN